MSEAADANAHHGPNHDYHLVDPSPWPLVTAFAAMIMVIMVVVTFQNKGGVYTGYSGNVWTDELSQEVELANASIIAKEPNFPLIDALTAAGARNIEGVITPPVIALWDDESAQILSEFRAGVLDQDSLINELGEIIGPESVSVVDGAVRIISAAAVPCGFGNFLACELLPDGSIVTSGAAFGFGITPFLLGLTPLLFCMGMWWRDVVREAHVEGHHTPIVQLGLRYGMLLFIVSEIFFFVAFFWAFFANSIADPWPSEEFKEALRLAGKDPELAAFHPLGIPLYNTVILLLSGTTVTQAHEALREDRQGAFQMWLGITVLLGILFTGVQIYEYTELPFGFGTFDYGSTFYAATGFHGFHVAVGTIFLAVCWFRARARQFTAEHHFGFEAAAWYWHFVDVVWVFLYVAIYWGLFVTNSTFH